MTEKIEKAKSDGTHVTYTTSAGRQFKFDLSTQEGKNSMQGLLNAMGVVGIQFAEELVGFNVPAGI